MPFFTQEDIETGNWKNRTEELMAMVNLYRSKNEELKADNETLEEKITCLESDSHNEVSLAEYEELKEKLDKGTEQHLADTKKLNDFYKAVKAENQKLKRENEKLKADNETLEEKITCLESDSHNEVSLAEYEELQEENEKLKENEEGIMDFIVSGSGLGCNSYEKFINLSSELEYSEELITKLKKENEEQLAAVECLKFMDYTYKDGRWMMDGEEEDEEEED
tara:strand:+ start:727 stop:1395 length:669 start_codon:yes stop_codon:yes gene_type:complete